MITANAGVRRGRSGGHGLAVLRVQAAHRRPRQQPAARHGPGHERSCGRTPTRTSPPDPAASTSPTTPSSSTTGPASSPTRRTTTPSSRSPTRRGRSCGSTAIPSSPAPRPGYLHEPDDAYLLKNGQVTVADAYNYRILFINHDGTVAGQIGTTGTAPTTRPTSIGYPNGDTPLADGNVLVSEINGSWITSTPRRASWSGPCTCRRSTTPRTPSSSAPTSTWWPTTPAGERHLEFNRAGQGAWSTVPAPARPRHAQPAVPGRAARRTG